MGQSTITKWNYWICVPKLFKRGTRKANRKNKRFGRKNNYKQGRNYKIKSRNNARRSKRP